MTDRPTYTELAKRLRPFYRIPAGKLTPQKKRFLTSKWKEFNRAGAVKFHKMNAKRAKQFKAAGYTVTHKGVFLPQRPGEKIEIREGHLKWKVSTRGVMREEFEFPLTPSEALLFVHDPQAVIDKIESDNPRIFTPRVRKRVRYRLVFSKGTKREEMELEVLKAYMELMGEPTDENDDPEDRLANIADSMVGLRAIYAEPRKR